MYVVGILVTLSTCVQPSFFPKDTVQQGADITNGQLSIDDLHSWSLRGSATEDPFADLNTYVRVSVLSLIVLFLLMLMYLVVYCVSRWVSPTIFHDKRKLRYMFVASVHGGKQGRNRTCILENGCSGGTMNKCDHAPSCN